ncbi:hypothetical protein [Streptomyces sp. bgisy027]|uniref:hypothetical protein n=1 Tax=Streptomyces sp. bgisy027 TaxID=3413770 RepID=UPI003D760E26
MNTASQNPGAQPPGSPAWPPAPPVQAAFATFGLALPAPAGTQYDDPWQGSDVPFDLRSPYPEPSVEGPVCAVCGALAGAGDTALYPDPAGRRYPSGAQVLFCGTCAPAATPAGRAVTAVVAREMAKDAPVTPRDIAAAEVQAGIVFDPQRIEAVRTAEREQARAEVRAELAQAQQDAETSAWFHARWRAVGQLCQGRHPDHMLRVGEVLAALDDCAPTTAPLAITWDGLVMGPSGDTPHENTIVPCTTARGGPAALVLGDEQRQALGEKLLTTVQPAEACHTPGCGTTDAEFAQLRRPVERGWIFVEVAGVDDEGGPRWWCNLACAYAAMTAAGAELAAAVDPHQQAPSAPAPDTGTDAWPPNGGHDARCAYAGGIGPNCTCAEDDKAAGGAR